MIKIEKNDSIIDILTKISNSKSKKIILDFPFGHPVLHNYLSLKIIKAKVGSKKLSIVTNDKTSHKICKLLRITCAKSKSKHSKNSEASTNFLKQNYSFWEYSLFEIKKFFSMLQGNIRYNKKINSIQYYRNKHKTLNKNIIVYFIFISIFIFLILIYIYYFAINKTTIEITPEINVHVKSRNYIYKEKSNNIISDEIFKTNEIPIEKITKQVSITRTIGVSGIKQEEKFTAKGKVEFYNLLDKKINLLQNTTLENKQGIQFKINETIAIPGATINSAGQKEPGKKQTTIYGKIKLLNGDYSGELANIGSGVLLTIPKLGDQKSKIFAKSISSFTGGSNDFIKVLEESDIEAAKTILENDLKQEAIKKIKQQVTGINNQNNIQMEVLGIDDIYKFNNLEIIIPEYLKAGDEIDEFNITGNIEVSSYIYNKQVIISKLKHIIDESTISEFEKILSINPHSLRISHIITRNDLKNINGKYTYLSKLNSPLTVKGTTEIEYYVSKNFENNTNNYSNKLKYIIAGKSIEEAEQLLINNREINNVSITVQPFFLKTISNIAENINIKVTDE